MSPLTSPRIMKKDFAIYYVVLKILLKKGKKVLILKTRDYKHFDLPGGRIDNIEKKTLLTKIISREVTEELGNEVKYRLGNPLFQYRRYLKKRKRYAFITIYGAKYISGKIVLSSEHSSYYWMDPTTYNFKEKDFFNKEEYLAFKSYFKFA